MSDSDAAQARQHHRVAQLFDRLAKQNRQQRDRLVRKLRADDPARWTYRAIAAAVGLTAELVAAIVKRPGNAEDPEPDSDGAQSG